MLRKIVALAVLTVSVTGYVWAAPAYSSTSDQTQAESPGSGNSLTARLDRWGKNLVGIFVPNRPKSQPAAPSQGPADGARATASPQPASVRAKAG